MKTLDPTFKARLQGGGSTLARLVDFTLNSGQVLRFTDSDRAILWAGNTYQPGAEVSQVQAVIGASSQSCTVTVLVADTGLTTTLIESGALDDAMYVVRVIDFEMPTLTPLTFFLGFVSKVSYKDRLSATIDGRPLSSRGVPLAVDKFSSNCRADLGDSRCKVNIDALKITGLHVNALEDSQSFTFSSTVVQKNGLVVFTSGALNGYSFEVNATSGGGLSLKGVMPIQPAVGDTFTLYPGCDKTQGNCNSYNNIVNFQGEPFSIAPYTASTAPTVATPAAGTASTKQGKTATLTAVDKFPIGGTAGIVAR